MPLPKGLLILLLLLPLFYLIYQGFTEQYGANPIQYLQQQTGTTAWLLLLLTLSITPLARHIEHRLRTFRRSIGLSVFFYAVLHVLLYLIFDQDLQFNALLEDIVSRPFISCGAIAFILLIPLALTSNRYAQRKMAMRWKLLHQMIYVIATSVLLHILWSVKWITLVPMLYVGLLLGLLLYRVWYQRKKNV